MKAFQTYIFELSKPSQFRVKMANVEPVGEVLEHIKQALDAYQLETISPVKSVPIQEHREFPQWGPCEAWTFDVTLAYPTTAITVQQLIKERAQINPSWICVRNLQEANDTADAEAPNADAAKGALLTQEDLGGSTEGQELAGQARIGSLLKELESRKFEFAEDSKESGKTTNDEAQGETSPVGTKQNKINDQRKGNTK
jgi:hypothetical protein